MPDFTLTAKPPLDGIRIDLDGVSVKEISDRQLVSISIPRNGEAPLNQAVMNAYRLELPVVGTSTVTPATDVRLMGIQRDQLFLLCEHTGDNPVAAVSEVLGNAGYYTDQSDSWAVLELSGPQSRRVLERICPVDLAPDQFAVNAVTRTVMEHLGVIVLRTGADTFMLFSATSSALSFLGAIETSARNVL